MFLTALQTEIAEKLLQLQVAEDGCQALQITTEAKGTLDTAIQNRIAQAAMALIVATPSITVGETADEILVDVVIVLTENILANQGAQGTRRPAIEIIELVYCYLQLWQPDEESWTPLQFQSAATRDADDETQTLFHTITFQTRSLTQTLNNLN